MKDKVNEAQTKIENIEKEKNQLVEAHGKEKSAIVDEHETEKKTVEDKNKEGKTVIEVMKENIANEMKKKVEEGQRQIQEYENKNKLLT